MTVQVVGKTNATIIGPDTDLFAPAAGWWHQRAASSPRKALAPGPCVVHGRGPAGHGPDGDADADGDRGAQDDARHDAPRHDGRRPSTHPGIDAPELEGLPCIDIFERELPNGAVSTSTPCASSPGEPALTFESKPIKDREQHDRRRSSTTSPRSGSNTSAEPRERERKLQDIGAKMFDELFPEDMQAYLWKQPCARCAT